MCLSLQRIVESPSAKRLGAYALHVLILLQSPACRFSESNDCYVLLVLFMVALCNRAAHYIFAL